MLNIGDRIFIDVDIRVKMVNVNFMLQWDHQKTAKCKTDSHHATLISMPTHTHI